MIGKMGTSIADDPATSRLDNFVDAAFAFALTLLVIGDGGGALSYTDLVRSLSNIPGFVASFALIGLFWFAHVQWRRAGGANDGISVVLSLGLVLAVLIYVYPMRLMVSAFVDLMSGQGIRQGFSLRGLFTIYGLGFAIMAGLIAGLFTQARRIGCLLPGHDNAALVWAVMACAGLGSACLAQFDATVFAAPWTYTLLPLAIPFAIYVRKLSRQ